MTNARLRYNGLRATLGASLTNSGTTITFAAALTHSGGTAVPTLAGGDYIPLSILDSAGVLSEVVYLTAYTSGATTGTITRGKESTTGVAHTSGDRVVHGPTSLDITPRNARAKRSSGDVSINSATFTNVDTGLDLTVSAAAGDVLALTLMARVHVASGTIFFVADFHTMVSGSPVNSVAADAAAGTTNAGCPAWSTGTVRTAANGYTHLSGTKLYTVQAGDISGGNVTLRLRAFDGGAVTVAANDPYLYVAVQNLGQ